jgi:undecaprenyl-diphosphatase
MSYLQACLLGCLQGLAEFLPVSSSAHLIIVQEYLGVSLGEGQILFNLILHLGTLLAILIVFQKEILAIRYKPSRMNLIALSLLPTIALGLLINSASSFFLHIPVVGCMLILNALILWVAHSLSQKTYQESFSKRKALWIGLAQGFAVIPGLSRSGLTITAGFRVGLDAGEAFSYSFILAIPTILMAFFYELFHNFSEIHMLSLGPIFVGFITSFLVGWVSLLLLKMVFILKRLDVFSYYCLALGVILLLKEGS